MLSPTAVSAILAILGAATSVRAQQSLWGQCGGIGWGGQTTCVSGAYCFQQNPYYFQCIPGSGPTTIITSTTTPPPAPSPSTSTTTSTPSQGNGGTDPAPTPGTCPSTPSTISRTITTLPDPFTFADGTTKVTSKSLFTCRQSEISTLFQRYELGTLPTKPTVSATFSGTTLSITASANGKSITFSVTINKPSGSSSNIPAIISYGSYGASIPVPAGVATILFNNDDIAAQQDQSSRGRGKFYDLYGASHSAGALTAWAWGVSRIIDALELTKAATGIDPTRIGVTGCSRNGKGAFVAGALEPRIALTLPQESGAGGSGCWRLAAWQNKNGYKVQDATQIVTENVWFSTGFNSQVNNVDGLPLDHHLLAGLVAPRALYVMENSDMEWLGKVSTYGCMGAARKVYQGLGALDKFGYSQVGGNSHCSFPSAKQGGELIAFIGKYLLGNEGAGTTSIYRTEGSMGNFNLDSWASWSVPTLA